VAGLTHIPDEAMFPLNDPISMTGPVVSGDQRGRTLGFPTANLAIPGGMPAPAFGVYAGTLEGRPAAIFVGARPTFGEGLVPMVEAHVLDFEGDLYGVTVTIELHRRIRDEQRFADAGALVGTLQRDCGAVRSWWRDRSRSQRPCDVA
jgi:riboflavin kinase/FMN adenylyltransferase